MAESPLADLTYRGYDGALNSPHSRWKVIMLHTLRGVTKKKSYWVLMVISSLYYFLFMAIAYFVQNTLNTMEANGMPSGGRRGGGNDFISSFFDRVVWADQFLTGFSFGHLMLMAIVLLVGAGVIANDNRTNALLVYLSKPCRKIDYLVGKWMGVFIPVCAAMLIPAIVFYLYGVMNYREHGFLADDPWLGPKLLIVISLAAAFQTSLIVGISSMFNQGRIAGAVYAGFYVLSGVFAGIAGIVQEEGEIPQAVMTMLDRVHYMSIYGGIEGLYKVILQTDGSGVPLADSDQTIFDRPPIVMLIGLVVIPALICMFVAWRRVRAVEVVS